MKNFKFKVTLVKLGPSVYYLFSYTFCSKKLFLVTEMRGHKISLVNGTVVQIYYNFESVASTYLFSFIFVTFLLFCYSFDLLVRLSIFECRESFHYSIHHTIVVYPAPLFVLHTVLGVTAPLPSGSNPETPSTIQGLRCGVKALHNIASVRKE